MFYTAVFYTVEIEVLPSPTWLKMRNKISVPSEQPEEQSEEQPEEQLKGNIGEAQLSGVENNSEKKGCGIPSQVFLAKHTWPGETLFGEGTFSKLAKWMAIIFVMTLIGGFIAVTSINTLKLCFRKTTTNIKFVYSETLKIPSVTLCTQTPVRRSNLEKLPVSVKEEIEKLKNAQDLYEFLDRSFDVSETWLALICYDKHFYFRSLRESLEIALFVNWEDIIGVLSSDVGYELLLHDEQQWPDFKQPTVHLSPGYMSDISIKKVIHEQVSSPFSNCVQEQRSLATGNPFKMTYEMCIQQCKKAAALKFCNCTIKTIPELDDNVIEKRISCQNISEDCVFVFHQDDCDCAPSCSDTFYETKTSISEWPTPYMAELLIEEVCKTTMVEANRCDFLRKLNGSSLRKYFTSFTMSFEGDYVTSYKEIPKMMGNGFRRICRHLIRSVDKLVQ
ncbi:hypothetical protein Btru_010822 [Bulinus truncatus]|nr:hypothetical protein Btru_010822 [Bulinus truncatus]